MMNNNKTQLGLFEWLDIIISLALIIGVPILLRFLFIKYGIDIDYAVK